MFASESMNESLKAGHTNDSYWAVLFCGTDHYTVHGGSDFPVWTITYPRVVFILLYKVVVMFASESVDESSVLPFK